MTTVKLTGSEIQWLQADPEGRHALQIINALTADRDEWKARAEAAEREHAKEAKRADFFQGQDRQHLDEVFKAIQERNAAKARAQETHAECDYIRVETELALEKAESELAALRAELANLEDRRAVAIAQRDQVRAENERLRAERDVYDDQAREVCRTLDRVIEERGDWYQRAEAAESHCKALAEDRSALRAENERLGTEKADERRIASEAWDRIRDLETSLYESGVAKDAAESRLAELEKELERLRALLVSDPIERARQYFERAKVAESRCAELEKEVERLRAHAALVESNAIDQEIENDEAHATELDDTESRIATAAELLRRCLPMDLAFQDVERDIVAFLANQPAAPAIDPADRVLAWAGTAARADLAGQPAEPHVPTYVGLVYPGDLCPPQMPAAPAQTWRGKGVVVDAAAPSPARAHGQLIHGEWVQPAAPTRTEAEQHVLDAMRCIPIDDIQLALDLRDGMPGAERRMWNAELARREAEK